MSEIKKPQVDVKLTREMVAAGANELSILGLCDNAGAEGAAEEVFKAMLARAPYNLVAKSTAES